MGKVTSSNSNKYYVNIPTLMGVPDNKKEYHWFQQFNEYLTQLNKHKEQQNENSKDTLLDFLKALSTLVNASDVILTAVKEPTDEDKQFMAEAPVCGLFGSRTEFNIGDTVVVGFLDNSLSKPIILGGYLTAAEANSSNEVPKTSLNVIDLSASGRVLLPMDTQFIVQDKTGSTTTQTITLQQIHDAIIFLNSILSLGITVGSFSALLSGSTLNI